MKKKIMYLVAVLMIALPGVLPAKPATTLEGVVNVNTASAEQLAQLPGIGPSKAEAIIAFRQAHPFKAVSELAEVKGIGPKMIAKIQAHVTVEGPTTLVEKPVTAAKAPAVPVAATAAVQK